jgi:hypothetical protein
MVVGGAVIMIVFGYIAVDAGRTGKVAHAMYQFGSQLPGSDKPLKIPGSGR